MDTRLFRLCGGTFLCCFWRSEFFLAVLARRQFYDDEPLRKAWSLIMLASAVRWVGLVFANWFNVPSYINPRFYFAQPWDTQTAASLREFGLLLGPIHMLLLAVGLGMVLRLYKRLGILTNLKPVDYFLLALVLGVHAPTGSPDLSSGCSRDRSTDVDGSPKLGYRSVVELLAGRGGTHPPSGGQYGVGSHLEVLGRLHRRNLSNLPCPHAHMGRPLRIHPLAGWGDRMVHLVCRDRCLRAGASLSAPGFDSGQATVADVILSPSAAPTRNPIRNVGLAGGLVSAVVRWHSSLRLLKVAPLKENSHAPLSPGRATQSPASDSAVRSNSHGCIVIRRVFHVNDPRLRQLGESSYLAGIHLIHRTPR